MASTPETQVIVNEKQQPKIQIYSACNDQVSDFWREKYEKDAKKYWDIFYKRHQDRFFKDRHYLDKEWGHHFSGEGRRVILEVGCGVGNTIFPLLATYPNIFAHACDFSPRAVNLVKTHKDFSDTRVNAFVCDLTVDDLSVNVASSSVDIVTMIFVLSAVSPEKMPTVAQNIRKILKPDGRILFRDYATGDLAQERFTGKEQKISENFYVRGDGTRAFYFSDEFLKSVFEENGFVMEEHIVCCKQVENRSREIVMKRRWIQAVLRKADSNILSKSISENEQEDSEVDMVVDMFSNPSSSEEIAELVVKDYFFKIKLLSKEYQHTCTSTGLMLWESSRLMASILAGNQEVVAGKRVLELGTGCGGICSMISATSASLVVATDGDERALDLLRENVAANLKPPFHGSLTVKKLGWGDEDDIEAIKQVNGEGFDVVIGTDVTYVSEAVLPLFATAKELVSKGGVVILCHVLRRVDEVSILSAAAEYGFRLVERWPESLSGGVVERWFSGECGCEVPSTALNIMYFRFG